MKRFLMQIEAECAAKVQEALERSKQRENQLNRELTEAQRAHNQLLAELQIKEKAITEFNDIESVEKKLEQLGGVPESKK